MRNRWRERKGGRESWRKERDWPAFDLETDRHTDLETDRGAGEDDIPVSGSLPSPITQPEFWSRMLI